MKKKTIEFICNCTKWPLENVTPSGDLNLPPTSCVTLSKLFHFSVPLFLHLPTEESGLGLSEIININNLSCVWHMINTWRISWAQILFFEVAMEKKAWCRQGSYLSPALLAVWPCQYVYPSRATVSSSVKWP